MNPMTDERLAEWRIKIANWQGVYRDAVKELVREIDRLRAELAECQRQAAAMKNAGAQLELAAANVIDELNARFPDAPIGRTKLTEQEKELLWVRLLICLLEKYSGEWTAALSAYEAAKGKE